MILCKDCEFYRQDADGRRTFLCDPFSTIKEAECLQKWQLLRLDMLLATYQSMNAFNSRLAPLQDKIFKYINREIQDIEDSESWKTPEETDPLDDDNDKPLI